MGEPTPTVIRYRTPAGSLLYLAKLLEEAVKENAARDAATQVAFALRVLAAGADDE